MKSISTLTKINASYRNLQSIIGETAFDIYSDTDPLAIYADRADDTYSVRGVWEADCLSHADLIDGILALGGIETPDFIVDGDGREYPITAAVNLMDDDIREEIHIALSPCSEQAFFDAYCEKHLEKYGDEFVIN